MSLFLADEFDSDFFASLLDFFGSVLLAALFDAFAEVKFDSGFADFAAAKFAVSFASVLVPEELFSALGCTVKFDSGVVKFESVKFASSLPLASSLVKFASVLVALSSLLSPFVSFVKFISVFKEPMLVKFSSALFVSVVKFKSPLEKVEFASVIVKFTSAFGSVIGCSQSIAASNFCSFSGISSLLAYSFILFSNCFIYF